VIAEAGVNHNGSLVAAKALIDVAKAAGADAVKFQAFYPELMSGRTEENLAMLELLTLPLGAWKHLGYYAYKEYLDFIVTPFDLRSLDEIQVPWLHAIKIASPDIANISLLSAVAETKHAVVLSTGGASLKQIDVALRLLKGRRVTLLHCIPKYPTPESELDLDRIGLLQRTFGIPVGFSDHSDCGPEVAARAVAAGATMLEKHFTLSRKLPGPDHHMSFELEELREYIRLAKENKGASVLRDRSEKGLRKELSGVAGRTAKVNV
jgi:sialic acid synthase SpsE